MRREWQEYTARQAHHREFSRLNKSLMHAEPIRQRAFEAVRQQVERLGVFDLARGNFRAVRPSTLIYRSREGEAPEDLINRLTIDLITDAVTDCYKVLEQVHRLGQPLAARFGDMIAHPHGNGYRALHTTIRLALGDWWVGLVEFRIRTDDMDVLNHHGVLAARFFPGGDDYAHVPA